MKRRIELRGLGRTTKLIWYEGTSDRMLEASAKTLLGLPLETRILLRDHDGDTVPVAGCLPPGTYDVVVFDAAPPLPADEPLPVDAIALPDDAPLAAPPTLPLYRAVLGHKRQRTASVSTTIGHFIEVFTVPIAANDVINFVPNHGPFALHSLYSALVPTEYDSPDATSFYKIASSAVVLDRQRAIRYYAIPPSDVVLLPPAGKGPILRAYLTTSRLQALSIESKMRLRSLAEVLKQSPDDLLAAFHRFRRQFTPISKAQYTKFQQSTS
ncbi:hypothetical protein SPRG_03207 [Saprolegnia parasitica CBS 223.65]|uniref:Uncharacterized protein n=1 Tax=Saprolegnia parasitica (strain CBS 223.65) TaxID=695850 RepID=A0A067CZN3_SAPPC|nr:hypothetical protein SPRG_03207 [Saprolegnia parasitica CBS 223.65]KDO31991.1 hypothetical protein SPRG_03207 [Saprolegnia parasitica CBS 223.65]|eukprot:XP_012197186.1 hypothetical protein SPRG_03207 [Saprolegnia parasitica CBS 223.65]